MKILSFFLLLATAAAFTGPQPKIVSRKASSSPLFSAANAASLEEAWTPPRLHNTATARSLALLGAAAVTGKACQASWSSAVHLLSYSTYLGTVVYTTFIAGITMFKNLPRQTFGKLQAKLFPKYFALCSASLVLTLVTLPALGLGAASRKALVVALGMTLVNQFYLEPASTNNMMERYNLEDKGQQDSERYATLKASFGKFHGMSSLSNLVGLVAAVMHGIYLSSKLLA